MSRENRTREWVIVSRYGYAQEEVDQAASTSPEEIVADYVQSMCNDCPDIIALMNDFEYVVRNVGSGESWRVKGSVETGIQVRTWDKKKL